MRKFTQLAILAIIPLGLFAARLTLRDGTVVTGRFLSGSEDRIVFQDASGVRRTFNTTEVQTVDFSDVVAPAGSQSNRDRDGRDDTANRADDRRPVWTTLPAGTQISVRTDETISADTANEGRTYPATIQRDILDNSGNVVIPRGSQANLVVQRVNEGGTVSSGNLVLDLDSIQVNGRRYTVSTEDVRRGNNRGIGANRRTGEMVGGGAVLGTLLGAIAGGGKGAAIGAIAGAAAGGGVQVLTKGKEIRVPAETVLNFRLDQPLQLREA
jgi:hypothetical protein